MKTCISCNQQIKPLSISLDEDEKGMFLDGAVGRIEVGYGSSFDGNIYLIAICDSCIEAKKESLVLLGNYLE